MFQASIAKALSFKKIIESVRELVVDVNFEVSQDGLALQAMDASHVALVSFILNANQFEEFECNQPQVFGVNIGNLAKILKCADNDDRITIRAESNASKLSFIFEGRQDEKLSQFNLNLMTLDTEQLGIPDHEYTAVIHIKSDEFTRICRELSQISDTLTIDINKEKVTFRVGGDLGDGEITLKHRETGKNPTIIEAHEPVACSYAMRYLNLFNKASVLSDEIILSISENLPLIVHFQFELGNIKFYLAPKVNDE
ncbi:hypothetical protein SteCoe_20145 [Stentor coeruleus]|uniref:DNA sliding clamp PCNA n=1 Tax=Stentor coeruleus TaxID=5963 RepID=A0A1R2BSF9_9CILI|nr:hypothetical protein SteCoe_20145 [Stentor coeruleus]